MYRQNQFHGPIGGPILKDKLFYFGDYQGTRLFQGIDTGLIPVPSLAEGGDSGTRLRRCRQRTTLLPGVAPLRNCAFSPTR